MDIIFFFGNSEKTEIVKYLKTYSLHQESMEMTKKT